MCKRAFPDIDADFIDFRTRTLEKFKDSHDKDGLPDSDIALLKEFLVMWHSIKNILKILNTRGKGNNANSKARSKGNKGKLNPNPQHASGG